MARTKQSARKASRKRKGPADHVRDWPSDYSDDDYDDTRQSGVMSGGVWRSYVAQDSEVGNHVFTNQLLVSADGKFNMAPATKEKWDYFVAECTLEAVTKDNVSPYHFERFGISGMDCFKVSGPGTMFFARPDGEGIPDDAIVFVEQVKPGVTFTVDDGTDTTQVQLTTQEGDIQLSFTCFRDYEKSRTILLHKEATNAMPTAASSSAAGDTALARATAELARWRSGELRFVPEVINVEEGTVAATIVESSPPQVGEKRSSAEAGPSTLAHLVRVKQEKVDAEEDRDDFECDVKRQALFTDFLQGKLDEMKVLATAAGADPAAVRSIMERQWRAAR